MNFCVLIPSFNEANTIGGLVIDLNRRGITTYVVDDGSTDKTFSIARDAGAIVVKHSVNRGKGAAIREGFRHILKKGFDAVLVMDGDNQHEVNSINDFLLKMNETGADIIIGNRMIDASAMPYIRKITNSFMSWLIYRVSSQKVPDSQCGFRLIKRGVLENVSLESDNFQIESELIIKAARKGFRIESVPIRAIYGDEKSKINPITDTFRFVIFIIKMVLKE
ncbi:MAG: glycosyltransferase family 2 protein [Candidatus Omnitrophota bacterium]